MRATGNGPYFEEITSCSMNIGDIILEAGNKPKSHRNNTAATVVEAVATYREVKR